MRFFNNKLLLGLVLLVLTSCQNTVLSNPAVNTKGLEATVEFRVDNVPYVGVATVPRKSSQKIQVNYPDKTKWGLFSTCHRVFKYANPTYSSTWSYSPEMFLENDDSCIMLHKQIDKNGNPHYAIINFTAGEQLEADLGCNGVRSTQVGASICQAMAGTYQKISFKSAVTVYTDDKCEPAVKESFYFIYKMTAGFCGYMFVDSKGEIHRLTTYGYETLDLD